MKIAKLLRTRKKLLAETKNLYDVRGSINIVEGDSIISINLKDLIVNIDKNAIDLVDTKCKIYRHNAVIIDKVFLLEELKNKRTFLSTFQFKAKNEYKSVNSLGITNIITYRNQIEVDEVRAMVDDLDLRIEKLEDEISEWNATDNII